VQSAVGKNAASRQATATVLDIAHTPMGGCRGSISRDVVYMGHYFGSTNRTVVAVKSPARLTPSP